MDRKKTCNCLNDCPCYPNCDQMMSEGEFAGVPESAWRLNPDAAVERYISESADGPVRRAGRTPFDARMVRESKKTAPQPEELTAEEENERDWQKLKEMYPDTAKRLFAEVENVCDNMEYEGSAMFDSMPDKTRVRGLAKQICGKMKDRCPAGEAADLDDMAQVLLYQEMFHRRCRRRGCRRW